MKATSERSLWLFSRRANFWFACGGASLGVLATSLVMKEAGADLVRKKISSETVMAKEPADGALSDAHSGLVDGTAAIVVRTR